jgi:hypothetical protein
MHPIMAAAGIAALLVFYLAIPNPRLAIKLVLVGLAVLAAAAFAMPTGIYGRFDEVWLLLVEERSPYLFLRHWQLEDWARVAVTLATLAVGIDETSCARARLLCRVALMTTVGGLALTWIACDCLHLVLITQLQPWRWQWLGTVVAAVLLPEILRSGWQSGVAGRTTRALLLAAWLFSSNEFALIAVLALAAAMAFTRRLASSEARLVFWGACGMLALATVWRVASNLEFIDAFYLDPHIPLWMRRTMSFVHDGSLPAAASAMVWWLACARRGQAVLILLAAAATGACVTILPQTWKSWTFQEFPPQRIAQFASLRAQIPPGSEVFLAESPVATWLLLDRPSYLSVIQTSGMVYSRPAALELRRRAIAIGSALSPQTFLGWNTGGTALNPSVPQLQRICQTGEVEFLVTSADLGMTPLAVARRESGRASHEARLYHCSAKSG